MDTEGLAVHQPIMILLQAIAFGLQLVLVAGGSQEYLSNYWVPSNVFAGQSYDSGLFAPLESLELLSECQFSTLSHPMFPHHSVQIKKTRFCYDTGDCRATCPCPSAARCKELVQSSQHFQRVAGKDITVCTSASISLIPSGPDTYYCPIGSIGQ
jgi:hypothetical protein